MVVIAKRPKTRVYLLSHQFEGSPSRIAKGCPINGGKHKCDLVDLIENAFTAFQATLNTAKQTPNQRVLPSRFILHLLLNVRDDGTNHPDNR